MSTPLTRRMLAFFLLAAALLPAYATGQATSAAPAFKSTSRIVLVDMVVTDSNGKPVHDLKARDFSVLDGGRAQPIVAFDEQRPDATARPSIALNLPDNIYTNYVTRSESGALTVLLFDALNASPLDLAYARNKMLDFLRKLPPGKRVGLYALGSQLRMVHSFTENSDELIAAAERLSTHGHGAYSNAKEFSATINELKESRIAPRAFAAMVRFLGEEYRGKIELRARYTLDGLTQLAHALAVVPGRKNVVWISAGLPFDISSNAQEWQKIAGLLALNRIAIYPVDARGLAFLGADAQVTGSEAFSQTQDYETTSGQGEENAGIIETLRTIADTTGGRAYINHNDLEAALVDILQTGSNYYTLACRPTGVAWNGQFRKITIKTALPHVKLLYRSGYYAISDPSNLKQDVSRTLAMAMLPGVPAATQFIMKARVSSPQATDEPTKIDILVDVHDLAVTEERGQKTPDVQFAAVAWDNDGKQCASFSAVVHSLPQAQYASLLRTGLQVHDEMPLKPGSYQLRLGVMDRLSGRIGTLDVPLTIKSSDTAR